VELVAILPQAVMVEELLTQPHQLAAVVVEVAALLLLLVQLVLVVVLVSSAQEPTAWLDFSLQTVKVVAVVLAEAMVLSLGLQQLASTVAELLTPQVTMVVELVLLTLMVMKFLQVAAEL
jgi:hypothetical protein